MADASEPIPPTTRPDPTDPAESPRPFAEIPGPPSRPLVGNILQSLSDPLGFLTTTAREYGPVATYVLGGQRYVQLSDPAIIEQVLVHDNQSYTKGERLAEIVEALGNGIFTSEGSFWRTQRHAIQPAFHPDAITYYSEIMVDATDHLTATWSDGETRDIYADMTRLTVDIAGKALFNVDITDDAAEVDTSLTAVMDRVDRMARRPFTLPPWFPSPGNRAYRSALRNLDDVADRIIEERRRADADDRPDVVTLLLDADDATTTQQQLRDEVKTILLAGHETTAIALTCTLFLLSENPAARATLADEFATVLDGDRPTMSDVADLTFLEQVVKESLRLYPPAYGFIRYASEDVVLGGYEIPAGTNLHIQQWVLHRDPRFFDEPDAFRPERWTREKETSRPRYAYFPFGGGPRRCVGDRFAMLEAQLVLATLLQEWTVNAVPSELSFTPSVTLRPAGPVHMHTRNRPA